MENVRGKVSGKNTKRKHLSKNKKKSWRKVNTDDVEEFLEDQRLQERSGGKVAEKKNESLFFVDKKSKDPKIALEERRLRKRKAQEKLTEIEETLKPPPPKKKDKRAPAVKEKIASGKLSSVQRTAIKQRQDAKQQRRVRALAKRKLPVADFDLWGDTLEKEHAKEDSHYLKITKRTRVQVPDHHKQLVSKLPAVQVPHGGSSYNPAFDEHQELLKKAHNVEAKKVRREEKIRRALDAKFPAVGEAPTEASRLEELSAGLFEEKNSTESDTEDVGDLDKLSVNPPVRRENKKDERQRKKEKERKEKEKQAEKDKQKRVKDSTFFRLKSIKADVKAREQELNKREEKKAEYRAGELYRTRRLGRLKYEDADLEIKLSEELVGSLREVKPEGHLLEDRFKSLQKRNIIEPRNRAKRPKKKYKPKIFDRKSHREIA